MFPSSNSQPKILPPLTMILVIMVTLLLGLATSTPSTTQGLFEKPTFHAHIINELKEILLTHCYCTDHDLGVIFVAPGTEYKWDFKKHYFFRSTLWQCYVSPQSKFHQNFIVFDDLTKAFDYNVYWVVKNEGIYFRDPSRGVDIFKYKWQPGRLSN